MGETQLYGLASSVPRQRRNQFPRAGGRDGPEASAWAPHSLWYGGRTAARRTEARTTWRMLWSSREGHVRKTQRQPWGSTPKYSRKHISRPGPSAPLAETEQGPVCGTCLTFPWQLWPGKQSLHICYNPLVSRSPHMHHLSRSSHYTCEVGIIISSSHSP